MTTPRIYLPQALSSDSVVALPEEASHHLLHVLRLRIGEKLVLFNGRGGEFLGELFFIDKKFARVKIGVWRGGVSESPLTLHLGQGIICGAKMDYAVQKAVELGVNYITPLFTTFCEVKLSGERLAQKIEHWQKIAVHASEQCGRCHPPQILPAQTLGRWVEALSATSDNSVKSDAAQKIILAPEASLSLVELPRATHITLLAGAEGGLSESEVNLAEQHGFTAYRIGPRILRAETAALTALAVIQSQWGDLR